MIPTVKNTFTLTDSKRSCSTLDRTINISKNLVLHSILKRFIFAVKKSCVILVYSALIEVCLVNYINKDKLRCMFVQRHVGFGFALLFWMN